MPGRVRVPRTMGGGTPPLRFPGSGRAAMRVLTFSPAAIVAM